MSDAKLYQVLQGTLISEKITNLGDSTYAFKVAVDASKQQIAQAVKQVLGVDAVKVRTLKVKGKNTVFRQRKGRQIDWKKAYVTLATGQEIDFDALA